MMNVASTASSCSRKPARAAVNTRGPDDGERTTVVVVVAVVQVQCCFTSTETVRTIRDGEPRTATSTFTRALWRYSLVAVVIVRSVSIVVVVAVDLYCTSGGNRSGVFRTHTLSPVVIVVVYKVPIHRRQ